MQCVVACDEGFQSSTESLVSLLTGLQVTLVGRAGTERLSVLYYRQEGIYYSILSVCVCLYI